MLKLLLSLIRGKLAPHGHQVTFDGYCCSFGDRSKDNMRFVSYPLLLNDICRFVLHTLDTVAMRFCMITYRLHAAIDMPIVIRYALDSSGQANTILNAREENRGWYVPLLSFPLSYVFFPWNQG